MSGKHYIYPTTSNGRSHVVDRERVRDRDLVRSSHYDSSDHSDIPALSRASTPSTFSSPPTPTLPSSLPTDSKMKDRHVEFASPVSRSYRRPGWDELSVMRAFASHTGHCDSCNGSLRSHRSGGRLCDRGTGLAKDLGTYFYEYDGKPHSNVDQLGGREKVQVEVPVEYGVVTGLFKALGSGLKLKSSSPSKPNVYQPSSYQTSRPTATRRYTTDSMPSSTRRRYLDHDHEDYDLRPARSDSRRLNETVYRKPGGRYVETRSPYYEHYSNRERRRPLTPPTPLTPRTPMADHYSSYPTIDSRRHGDISSKRPLRKLEADRDRPRFSDRHYDRYSDGSSSRSSDRHSDKYSDKYTKRFPSKRLRRRSDTFDDRSTRRPDNDRRRRESRRHYNSDDEIYRQPKRLSSYGPFSYFWRH